MILEEIIWYDASSGEAIKGDVEGTQDFLIECHTYGRVYYEDDFAVILATSETRDTFDYFAIPKFWIEKRIKYGQKNTRKKEKT